MTVPMGVNKFENLFRRVANLDVDNSDIKRLNEFLNQKAYDLLVAAESTAQANNRDIIQLWDLPLTQGIEKNMEDFTSLEKTLELTPIFERIITLPALDLEYSAEVESSLATIAGALTISLAKIFKQIDPGTKNPQPDHWERAINIFDMLL